MGVKERGEGERMRDSVCESNGGGREGGRERVGDGQ